MKRRTFIGKTISGIAAVTVGSHLVSSCTGKAAGDKVVLGLIGAGHRGRKIINNTCQVNQGVEIKYICDINELKLQMTRRECEKQLGYSPTSSVDMNQVFDDPEVDAVMIATPEHWHALATLRALEAGKHVYVEKNPSLTVREGRKMTEATDKYKKVLQVGFQSRSASYAYTAREFIQSGRLGKVVHVKSYNMLRGKRWESLPDSEVPAGLDWDAWLGPAPYRPYNPGIHHMENRGGWLNYWDFGGGKLSDDASHVMDMARLVLGDPQHPGSVYCCGGNWAWGSEGKETPEFMSIIYDFGDFTMTCESGSATNYMKKTPPEIRMSDSMFPDWRLNATRTEIYGTEGIMYLGRHGGGWQVFGEKGELIAQEYGIHPDTAHQQNFIASIRGLEKPNANALQGHLSACLVHLGNIAYRVGNKHLVFSSDDEEFTNNPEANKMLKATYRDNYKLPDRI